MLACGAAIFCQKGRENLFLTGHDAEGSRQHASRISAKGKAVLISDTLTVGRNEPNPNII